MKVKVSKRTKYILLLSLALVLVLGGTKAFALTTLNPPGGVCLSRGPVCDGTLRENSSGNVGVGTTRVNS